MSAHLESLRALLAEPPSHEGWQALVDLLDPWPDAEELALGIAYAEEHLDAAWPDALRQVPQRWLEVLMGGKKELSGRQWARGERAHPGLRLCRSLCFGSEGATGRKLKDFAKAGALGGLRRLSAQAMTPDAPEVLARVPGFTGYRSVDLSESHLGDQGVERTAALLRGVEALALRQVFRTDEGPLGAGLAAALASAAPSVVSLCLSDNLLTGAALEGLLAQPFPKLEVLELESCGLTAEAAASLKRLEAPALRALRLGMNPLGWEVVQALGASLGAAVVSLDLQGALPSGGASEALRGWPTAQLRALDLSYSPMDAATLTALAALPWGSLEALVLRDVGLEDAALEALEGLCAAAPQLERLDVAWSSLSSGGMDQIRQLRSGLSVEARWSAGLAQGGA